ncbi:hydantoinase/oxoprolinase family protein [Macrococcoides bohemicum]|uniref:Hydantoinase/oxoprolinase family protein n=1 Tax=Macrococcoides bohemicum TaxID=1903056 RepID=A0AAJ4TWV7_9STAP|nr:hydantoinase/oxoprolinase family protein [Macrococcus bohemicus]QYA42881.1 hydantoinase/oxoprolinase family protein [Macrococcus bohemicus]QYA45232.1 hydantoinase/oxoprolinase family protein [Macrococcus bohemicus]
MRVATDIGGTFTDLVAVDSNGKIFTEKSDTTPGRFDEGIMNVIKKANIEIEDIEMFFHGTTVVINALTEKKGVKTGLITTKGFRDVLEIGRGNRPDLFNLRYKKPASLIDRHLRKEVSERLNQHGEVLSPLKLEEVDEIINYFKSNGVEAVAISLLHSYKNNEHERMIAEYVHEKWPEVYISTSTDLSKEWREYERTSTAVLNAYIKPIANNYLTNLENKINEKRKYHLNYIMQSNGGTSTFDVAKEVPINMVESGPVAGIFGAKIIGDLLNEKNLIVLDIGGTTAKCSLVKDGEVRISTNYHLEKTNQFAGYPLKVPVVDIIEIGNGGGSIAWVDESGSFRVGPHSAAAEPGPISYGKGGTEPTTTDANVILGRLSLSNFDSSIELKDISKNIELALGEKLNMSAEQISSGILKVANSNMLNALKLISVRKGYDPRDFVLVAIGGGGPMHSQDLARELGVKKVIIPAAASVFASWGMLLSDLRHDYTQTILSSTEDLDFDLVNKQFNSTIQHGINVLDSEGIDKNNVIFSKSLDMRYAGQEHTVEIPIPNDELNSTNLKDIINKFHESHERMYSYKLIENSTEIVNIKVQILGKLDKPIISEVENKTGNKVKEERNVFFEEDGWCKINIYDKSFIEIEEKIEGPAIIEEKTTSTVINKYDVAYKDKYGNLIIEIGGDNNEL